MPRKPYETYKLCIAFAVPTSSRATDLFSLFSLSAFPIRISELGPVQTGRPPPVEGADGSRSSSRVCNTRQESGNGPRERRTGSRSMPQYGTRIRDWVPARLAIGSPFIVIY